MSTITIDRSLAAGHASRRQRLRTFLGRFVTYGVLTLGAIASLLPFLWMLSTSFKQEQDAFTFPPTFIPNPAITDNYAALIAPGLLGNAFGTFLMRQFFLTLPGELEEAARIDGAGRLRIFATIAVPLSKPAVATLAVLTFVNSWNNFLWPLIVINSDNKKMLTVGLSTFQGQFNTHW